MVNASIHFNLELAVARNQSEDYATMDEDERRRFAGAPPTEEKTAELQLDDPRRDANQGHSQVDRDTEAGDPRHRDGLAAQLDDESHDSAVRKSRRR
ncbi:MAG TPA: hypothetical protein VNC60_02990 [Actinomycetota bacterium]|nr:hypothetical protein [Actinomycetota bacterium]